IATIEAKPRHKVTQGAFMAWDKHPSFHRWGSRTRAGGPVQEPASGRHRKRGLELGFGVLEGMCTSQPCRRVVASPRALPIAVGIVLSISTASCQLLKSPAAHVEASLLASEELGVKIRRLGGEVPTKVDRARMSQRSSSSRSMSLTKT